MMVSSGDDQEKAVLPWLRPILSTTFDSLCVIHDSKKLNYCIDCKAALCDKCKMQRVPSQHEMEHVPSQHKTIRAYKIREGMSFRMNDLKSLWDISDIRPYTFNEHRVAYVHKRGDGIAPSHGQSGLEKCESCQYSFKSQSAKYCSVECKVKAVTESVRKQPRKQKNPQRAPFY